MSSCTFELSLTENYVSEWGMKEGVREVIQNGLDSSGAFSWEFIKDLVHEDQFTFRVHNEGIVLAPETLLLGKTSKTHDEGAIGSFGEGFKLALLVLTREGYRVEILNGAVEWLPSFRLNRNYGCKILVIDQRNMATSMTGLTFQIHGLSRADRQAIESICLRMQKDVGEIKRTPMGDILLERKGELYVGDLFVCQTELDFGYNVLPKHLKLERDRQTVDGWDLKVLTTEMWYATKEFDKIADMMAQEVPDVSYARYSATDMVKEACYAHFRSKHPNDVIAETNTELNDLIERGMTVYVGNSNYYHSVSTSRNYRAEPQNQKPIPPLPQKVLEQWLTQNRKEMRGKAIESYRKELILAADKWRAKE